MQRKIHLESYGRHMRVSKLLPTVCTNFIIYYALNLECSFQILADHAFDLYSDRWSDLLPFAVHLRA